MKLFHFTPVRRSIVGLLFALGGLAVVVGVKYAYKVRERRLHALFAGPCEVSEVTDPTYYPRLVYDLRAYVGDRGEYPSSEAEEAMLFPVRSKQHDIEWMEGATREQFEAMRRVNIIRRERRTLDATTGATLVEDRLRWREVYREQMPSRLLRISYPPDGAVFPPNLCEPHVEWDDGVNNLWQVTVGISGTPLRWSFVTTQRQWRFPSEIWRIVRKKAVEYEAWIQVKGVQRLRRTIRGSAVIQASPLVHFRISEHPADNYIVYRLVSPQFQAQKTPDTFIRELRSFMSTPV